MSDTTRIDTLSIEIQTSSSGAADNIDKLVESLGKLKKVGSFGVAVKNLKDLSGALNGLHGASAAGANLQSIAKGIEALKAAGTFGSIASNFSKLSESLGKLDSAAIDGFVAKIKELNDKIEPVSKNLIAVGNAIKNVNTTSKSAGNSVGNLGKKVNTTMLNMSSLVTVARGLISTLRPIINLITNCIDEATEWDGVSARFVRGFGDQAKDTYEWIQRLNKEMGINVQQFMQYSSTYATMLRGFGVASEDASEMALGYMELTYDIWAGYNDIYKSMDDAATAVRSAIAGEVEPVRKAGFTIIESTLKQTAANHGLEISLENATEAQKSYLRYLTLVDQAQAQGLVGAYAKEMDTAEGVMRTFNQQLKSLGQTFGSVFIPVLIEVMPHVQALVELLGDAIRSLAALFGIEIKKIDFGSSGLDGVTDSANEATEAVKELKNATLGIDELNVISASSSSGSGGSSGDSGVDGWDVSSMWDESVFAEIGTQVDEIKGKLEDWFPVIELVGLALGGLAINNLLSGLGTAIGDMNTLSSALATVAVATIEAALVFKFADNYLEEGGLLDLVGEALTTAGAGYILYKGFGDKGAALALAVSLVAQIAAIEHSVATGKVDIDDPKLWIQSAMTALTGAAAGMFTFKGIKTIGASKGAVIGLFTGISLSLAAVTAGKITEDGKLTFESAMTGAISALSAGVAGGQLFKYLGKDVTKGAIIGMLASLSLTIASVAATTDDAFGDDLMTTITSALAMGATGAGIGTMIAPGVGTAIGFGIGAVVSLAISGISTLIGNKESEEEEAARLKKELEDNIAERFGDIELSVSDLEVYVENISAIPGEVTLDFGEYETTVSVTAALEFYAIEKDKLEQLEEDVQVALQEIDSLTLKIALGIEVDPETYSAAVDSFVTSSQSLLDQQYLTASVALSILELGDDSASGLSGSLSTFYVENSAKLTELGGQLKQTISDAFVDGEWIPDKLAEAAKIQAEINEVLEKLSEAEFKAKILTVDLDASGADFTPESFDAAMEKLKGIANDRLSDLEDVRIDALKVAILQYDANLEDGMSEAEATDIYNQQVADIQYAFSNGKASATFGYVDWGLSTLQEQFSKELNSCLPNFQDVVSDTFAGYITQENTYDKFAANLLLMKADYKIAVEQNVTDADKEMIKQYLAKLAPELEDYAEIAEAAYEGGKMIPAEVRSGMNDAAELAALTGDIHAIDYLIGQGFTTDQVFLNTLSTVEGAGDKIKGAVRTGFLTNIDLMYDDVSGAVVGIKDATGKAVLDITPELKANLESMGVDMSAGLKDGATAGMKANEKDWKDLALWPWNWFKEKNEINSPSKLFKRGGKYLTDGLASGMSLTSLSGKLSSIWNKAKTWWNGKGSLKTYTPTIGNIKDKLSSAWSSAKSWWNGKKTALKKYTPSIGSIKDKVSSAWTTAKTWWNKSKSSLSKYTPSIGSIKSNLSSAWTKAKTWWNNSKGAMSFTPTIGSIKDKLSSAWNTAKTWWGSNVKLSIPSLDFNVTYTEATGWKKAITSALGLQGWPKLSFAASGGIFDTGSLVWAGERGPEIVANASGGKTGVMNVQQMSEAVYEGVYSAVVAAMRATSGNGGSQAVNVYLDGKQITSSVEQRQKERGATLMGSQVYSY